MAMAEKSSIVAAAVLGALLAVGLIGAGRFVSTTVYKGRLASNAVTVKGFAERDVKADLALWHIGYSVIGEDLADVYGRSRTGQDAVLGFLAQQGFKSEDIKADNLNVTDLLANPYRPKDTPATGRYILKNTISVRSRDVDLVDRATHELNGLMRQGIVLTANSVDNEFTKLGDIKAVMLREATQNARDAAQQFANDAGSKVGSIQSANQGFFSIVSRDAAAQNHEDSNYSYAAASAPSSIDKKVRVVVTLTYYLEK